MSIRKWIAAFATFLITASSGIAGDSLTISTFDQKTAVIEVHKLLGKAYRNLGIEMGVVKFPASRALVEANLGNATDGELIRISGLTKQFPNLIEVPVRIANFRISVFSKNTTFKVDGWPSLKPYEIAFMRGFKGMEKHADGLKVYRTVSSEAALRMVHTDRTDIAVLPHLDGLILLQKLKMTGEVRYLLPPLEDVQLYHYLHKKHENLVPKITGELKKMEMNGEIDMFWKKFEDNLVRETM